MAVLRTELWQGNSACFSIILNRDGRDSSMHLKAGSHCHSRETVEDTNNSEGGLHSP